MKNKKFIGAGLVSAIAASLCCITPLLAIVAGSGGLASSFSWMEPFRPYLIAITIVVLGFAWYNTLKPKNTDDCGCEVNEKPKFMESKFFLTLVTLFSVAMLAFPQYSHVFYTNADKPQFVSDSSLVVEANFYVKGMTCEGCEAHVKGAVANLPGVIHVEASYVNGDAQVKYDSALVQYDTLLTLLMKTGYEIRTKN